MRFFLAQAAAVALVACGGEAPPEGDAVAQPVRNEAAPSDWSKVAPGVWERTREDGVREQVGVGTEAAEFELQRVRGQRALLAQVQGKSGTSAALDRQLAERDQYIQALEKNIAEARAEGVLEQMPESPPRFAQAGTEGAPSGSVCGGSYSFNVQFSYHMAGGVVTTEGNFSEFGPYSPYSKELYIYAKGWLYSPTDPNPHETSKSSGLFTARCCVSISTSAIAYPTFTPNMEGGGVVLGANGCGFRSYRAWNY
ncbi:hypothetical protein [Comamonas sp. JC664]|uniref:hypothetical protein n=1 Tax=Comamonas sp. JC664 TaxID=2801917 RepID=UPI00174A2574|nr:hypothetical protein [Comamonas sp. JC664]MBL0692291.1 hypothetical protein [Comamonas sp. JC664]GHG98374.1 hypothetical protein GCM10012319_64020 [Comamonas sp. KCTC 72670]